MSSFRATVEDLDKHRSKSVWLLMWQRFRQHKLGIASLALVFVLIVIALFAEFISPYSYTSQFRGFGYAPPTRMHLVDQGTFTWRPFVYGVHREFNRETFDWKFTDTSEKYTVHFFVKGSKYKLLGFIPSDLHLIGLKNEAGEAPSNTSSGKLFLFGSDNLGRDLFSRTMMGTRISLLIGPLVILVSFIIGIILGGISGFYGGFMDSAIQRCTEVIMAIPRLALLLAMATVIPVGAPPEWRFWGVVLVLMFVSWAPLCRVIRGQFLQLREADFSIAAQAMGARNPRIIFRHILPSTTSYLVVTATLTVPSVIILESSLSFLNYGIQEPLVSWGMLMQDAHSVFEIQFHPWYLIPGFFIVVTVLAFNFMGDALRDAADPFTVIAAKE